MELHIGHSDFTFDAVDSAPGARTWWGVPLEQGAIHIYTWDCRTQGGVTDPRPTQFTARAGLRVTNIREAPDTPAGSAEQVRLQKMFELYTGLDAKGLRRVLDDWLPPITLPVPYATLIDPYKATETRMLTAQVTMLRWLGDLTPTAVSLDPPRNHLILEMPIAVTFAAEVKWLCLGDFETGYLRREESVTRLRHGDRQTARIKAHAEALEAARRKFAEDSLDLLPFILGYDEALDAIDGGD